MTDPVLSKLIRFQRPERVLTYSRDLTDQTLAGIFGSGEAEFRAGMADLDEQLAAATARLTADPQVREDAKNLTLNHGDHFVAIGESSTADRLSWFELLSAVLMVERPDLDLRFDNLAFSGATSTQTLAALPAIRRSSPDWLFCMLGANDCQRFESTDGPRLVSPNETRRNLRELRSRALPRDSARWVWLTPTPIDQDRADRFPFFAAAGISWTNTDLAELSADLLETGDPVVDSAPALASAVGDAHLDDGIHPSLATHEALAVRTLSLLASL